ncbi:MAG: hypothetical protein JW981_03525, partial [Anaerolineae bacterium]|nr:hypothetical protein [Anaerolineae bacterium]
WIRARQGPDWKRMAIAAVVLGLALGVKSTVLMVIPIFGAFILWGRPPGKNLKPYIFQALIACGIAFAVLWGLYRFEFGPTAGVPFPIPMPSHLLPLLRLQQHMGEGHSAFLMGQNYHQGRWIYFPIAFALKTPLLTLGLLLLTIPGLLFKYLPSATTWHDKAARFPWLNREEIFMVALPVLYFGVSMNSGINIGYRHLLPVLPFVYVWVSRIALLVHNDTNIRHSIRSGIRWAGGILLTAYAATTLLLFPWHLSYFNAIAGGPDNGWKFLADSNTDWGQTLRALARYQEANDLGSVKLSMFIFLDPAMYNVEYEPIAPMTGAIPVLPRRFNPEPGLYAISATTLDGVPLPDPDSYDWFRNHEPFTKLGYVTFLYQVEPNEREWLAQCTQPVPPIDDSRAIAEGFGSDTLRQIYFNCEEGWIWPEQGNTDGWYALNTPDVNHLNWPPAGIRRTESLELWPTWTQRLNFAAMHKSYTQRQSGNLPPFTIWEWNAEESYLGLNQEEVKLADTLVFLGYDAPASARAGETLEVITYWRVDTPPGRPLSLMLHLLDASGAGVAVGDGLGVPVNQWQAGDVIAQRHPLQIPGEAEGEAVLVTGAYWLDAMDRLASEDGQDSIRLSSMNIR